MRWVCRRGFMEGGGPSARCIVLGVRLKCSSDMACDDSFTSHFFSLSFASFLQLGAGLSRSYICPSRIMDPRKRWQPESLPASAAPDLSYHVVHGSQAQERLLQKRPAPVLLVHLLLPLLFPIH